MLSFIIINGSGLALWFDSMGFGSTYLVVIVSYLLDITISKFLAKDNDFPAF